MKASRAIKTGRRGLPDHLGRLAVVAILVALITGCARTVVVPTPGPTLGPVIRSKLGDTRTRSTDGMEMVYVPAGTFQMGSNDVQVEEARVLCEQYPDEYGKCQDADFTSESPPHAVTLDGFWIDRTEVTNAQYGLCAASGACPEARLADSPAYNGEDYPVAGIPWQDAGDLLRLGWRAAAGGGRVGIRRPGPRWHSVPLGERIRLRRGQFLG